MSYISSSDPEFISMLESWFSTQGEILVLIRFSHSAGAKSFEFFSSFHSLQTRIEELPPKTCLTVFKDPQLPLRGKAEEDFIARCQEIIPDQTEFLLVEMTPRTYGSQSWFHHSAGESHTDLRQALSESKETPLAVGLYPPWLHDTETVISAVIPDERGLVITGVY